MTERLGVAPPFIDTDGADLVAGIRLNYPLYHSPQISKEPHFINYVQKTAEGLGFDVINLYTRMQPYARKALLYWRDDIHWNARGNEVVAEILSKHPLFRSD
jgi:hypothetical protein